MYFMKLNIDSDISFHIKRVETIKEPILHMHNFIEITYVDEGEGIHVLGGKEYKVSQGDLFIINYDVVHGFRLNSKEPLILYNCMFTPGFLSPSLNHSHDFKDVADDFIFSSLSQDECKTIIGIKVKNKAYVGKLLKKMCKEYEEQKKGYACVLRANLIELIINIIRNANDDCILYTKHSIDTVTQYINEHYNEKIKLEEIAAMINMSVGHFSRLFKEKRGCTIVEYIQSIRIEKACDMLKNTKSSIHAVSEKVGYDEPRYFNTLFKKIQGMTPGEYRKNLNNKGVIMNNEFTLLPFSLGTIERCTKGEKIYTNTEHTWDGLPKELYGERFIKAPIQSNFAKAKGEGWVYIVTATDDAIFPMSNLLLGLGFKKVEIEAFKLYKESEQLYNIYSRYVYDGDIIQYGQNGVTFFSDKPIFKSESKEEKGIVYPSIEQPANVIFDVPDKYKKKNRSWQGLGDVERAANGRLWVTWFAGGTREPHKDNYVILGTSADDGATWSEPVLVIDHPSDIARVCDSTLWIDPTGKMWLFYIQLSDFFDPMMSLWAITTTNPEDPNPTWTEPKKICTGFKRNKPTVLSSGEWLICAYNWDEEKTAKIYISTDKGETWYYQGGASTGRFSFDEHMVVEKNDGSLWMLIRTNFGLGQSFSYDKGKTWTEMTDSGIKGPDARFFISRLPSGNLLLINHYNFTARSHMTALLSEDDGATWAYKLLLDERSNVTYPDATVTNDGTIYAVYDRERHGASEVLMAIFNEEDIKKGEFVGNNSHQKMVITSFLS